MIVLSASADMLQFRLEPDDGRFWLLLRDIGANPDGVDAIIVTISREGLTDESCIENFDRERARELQSSTAQRAFFDDP